MPKTNSNVQQFGRIQYVDPNDFIEEKYNNSNNAFESFNITHPYEDYSLSVDLEVIIPNRNGYANNSDNTHTIQIANKEINGDIISFFSGTDGYMTDNPGSTTYVDLIKGDMRGINESLGITNIYISYTSYFYPEVTINFSDVRGSALMMPNEEIYMRAAANELAGEDKYDTTIENFFSAVFSFPSPVFKLSVKGFYGKKVEYSLMIEDFKSSFNHQTGNFDATIKFIGKMYGVYTDIPMSYLLVAPYCRYGSSGINKTIWEEKKFTIDGHPMPTLIELKEQIAKLTSSFSSAISYNAIGTLVNAEEEETLLHEIEDSYNKLVSYINSQNNESIGICDDNLIFLKGEEKATTIFKTATFTGETFQCNFSYINENTEILKHANDLYDKIENYNFIYKEKKIPQIFKKTDSIQPTDYPEILIVTKDKVVQKDQYDSVFEEWSYGFDYTKKYPFFCEKMINLYYKPTTKNEKIEICGLIIDGNTLFKTLKNRFEECLLMTNEFKNTANANIEYHIENFLGFNPSIQNVFMILMAHLETFMELYCKLITNITGENNRTVEKYGLSFNNTDINNIGAMTESKTFLPPFPLVKDKKNNEITYPSQFIMNGHRIEEVRFIDSFLNGTFSFLDELQQIDESVKNMTEKSVPFLPICFTDYYILKNPYEYVFEDYDGSIYLDRIITYFGYRYATAFILRGHKERDSKFFGTCEAYNFWRQHINLNRKIINNIMLTDFNSDEALMYLAHSKNSKYLGNQSPCFKNNDKTEYIFKISSSGGKVKNETITVSNIRPHPVCIEDTLDNFWNTIENGNDTTSVFSQELRGKYEAPTKYFHLMDKNILIDWYENIKQNDFTKLGIDTKEWETAAKAGGDIFFPKENVWYGQSYLNLDNIKKQTEIKTYFEKGETIINFYKLGNIKSLYDYNFEDGFEDETDDDGNPTGEKKHVFTPSLDGFQSEKDLPIFFQLSAIPGMKRKAEVFLMSIPHNFKQIGQACANYGGVISLPYVTQLYLGMLMEHIIEDSEEDFKFFIDNILDVYGQHIDINLMRTLCALMRSNDDKFLEYAKEKIDIKNFKDDILTYRNYFKKDILGLVDKYLSWRDSEEGPGFVYLYKMYALKENNDFFHKDVITTYDDIEKTGTNGLIFYRGALPSVPPIETNGRGQMYKGAAFITTGNTMLQRFIGLADNEFSGFKPFGSDGGTGAYFHTEQFGGNPQVSLSAGMLNGFYLPEYAKSTKTSFTDRYYKIHAQFKDGKESEWYEYLYGGNIVNDFKEYERQRFGSNHIIYLTFNRDFEAYKHLDMLFRRYDKLVIPHNMVRPKEIDPFANTGNFETAFNAFKEGLKVLYNINNLEEAKIDFHEISSDIVSENNKLSIYRTFKNLYDKHLTDITSKISQYRINEDNSEFKRCYFIDTYYNNLGDKIKVNSEILCKILDRVTEGYTDRNNNYMLTSTMNVLEFMSSLCQEHGMLLLCTPFFNGSLNGNEGIENLQAMFTPLSYNDSVNTNNITGPSYIGFYPHQASQHLDNQHSQYKNDGLNILDIDDNYMNSLFSTEEINTNEGYNIPAFAVEYGSQKQSIFKNVNVNMDNPQITEAAVAYQFDLIEKAGDDPKKLQFEGQDLFKIYTNYSYTCEAEMMGCAQIQPLMYFQLNNIPMFKGIYQIIQVTHNIVPGDMTTSFKGVRINRNKIPMIKGGIIFTNIDTIISNMTNVDKAVAKKFGADKDINHPDLNNIDFITDNILNAPNDKDISYQKINNVFNKNVFFQATNSGIEGDAEKSFNSINPKLRQLFYAILTVVEERKPYIKVLVTSSTRDISRTEQAYSKSDHSVGSFDSKPTSPSDRRKELRGKVYNGTEEVPYSELGCAIDLCTTDLNAKKDGATTNVDLFGLIAVNFTDYIRQLIWEHSPKYGDTNSDNTIGNCIHLSSYGKRGKDGSDKTEIFVSNDSSGKSIKADNSDNMSTPPKNIPITFLEIISQIPENKFQNVSLINWKITKPTQQQIKEWIDILRRGK